MEYLRTLGSAAVSTLVQKSGLNLPFSLGPKVTSLDDLCSLYDGTKREDGSNVSIFEYDLNKSNYAPLARNALRKLRTVRHPDILKFMDVVESDTTIFIMTERVRPLQSTLDAWSSKNAQEREDWILWGLQRVSVALAFINDSCASTHGHIRTNSIFISPSGEWKLGGFELLSSPSDESAVLYTMGGVPPDAMSWASPEVKQTGWSVLKQADAAAFDAYSLGLLLNAVFNPNNHPPPTATPPHPAPTTASRHAIPNSVFPHFKKLLNPNPKSRLTSKAFLELGMSDTGFFATNRLVKVCNGLDGFSVASEAEKSQLLRTLTESVSSFPPEFAAHRILPSLVTALEFGGASAATILPLVLQFGKNVADDEWPNVIMIPLVKLFASPDRGTRMALLDHLPEYIDKLDKKTVDSKVFPHIQTGFSDTVAIIREATVKAMSLIAPKLSDRMLNNDLLRHLAKMQSDPEASIRTNTCILIGRLGPSLGYHTKRKVLVPAFSRALKDTFVHARVAGLMAFMATIDCFDVDDLASKVLPSISPSLIDKEKLVRDQAFKAFDLFVKKLETHASTMVDTVVTDPTGTEPTTAVPAQATLVNSAAGAAGALAGWAISSLGKRLAATDMTSTMASAPGASIGRPTSVPPIEKSKINSTPLPVQTSISGVHSAFSSPLASPSPGASMSKTKGMQLGANRVTSSTLAQQWMEDEADDPWGVPASKSENDDNPWGNNDLMDVNADQDDWSAFETAPAPVVSLTPAAIPRTQAPNVSVNGARSSGGRPLSPKAIATAEHTVANNDWDNDDSWSSAPTKLPNNTSLSLNIPLSREEKAAEMARRKEERKQRIAMLKEQKKNASK